jgi:xylulokinase
MHTYLLGIDIGTGSCKGTLLGMDGAPTGKAEKEHPPLFLSAERVEQDPRTWWQSASEVSRRLLHAASITPGQIAGVGITGQMRGITLIGKDGASIRPSILWNDRRCTGEVDELRRDLGEPLRRITRNPLNEMCSLPKLLWLWKNEAQLAARVFRVIFPKDYIVLQLTGELSTDVSDASGSSLYDLAENRWSEELFGASGLPMSLFPRPRRSMEVVGTVTAAAAAETGIPQGTPVVAGCSDATAEMAALGITDSRQCKVRLGTSGALSTVTETLEAATDKVYVWSYLEPGRWMLDLNTRSCAQSVEWIRGLCYQEEKSAEGAYARMIADAAGVPAGSAGVTFHPYLLGEDAPYWDPSLKGSFFGLSASHTRGHLVRAVFEGTAFALRDAMSAFGHREHSFEEFLLCGGGARNSLWSTIVATVLGRDLAIVTGAEASVGACILAAVGVGVSRDVRAARKALFANAKVWVEINREERALYQEKFLRYRTMKGVYDGLYHDRDAG